MHLHLVAPRSKAVIQYSTEVILSSLLKLVHDASDVFVALALAVFEPLQPARFRFFGHRCLLPPVFGGLRSFKGVVSEIGSDRFSNSSDAGCGNRAAPAIPTSHMRPRVPRSWSWRSPAGSTCCLESFGALLRSRANTWSHPNRAARLGSSTRSSAIPAFARAATSCSSHRTAWC